MSTHTGDNKNQITSLSPEIFLKIFLNLASQETVILRGVCKEFFEIIENNKSLWRIFEWTQQEGESPIPALEMFDEKSGSTLKEISIFQAKGYLDNERLIEVLDRSKNTLTDLSLKLCSSEMTFFSEAQNFPPKLIELASNLYFLNSLILWPSAESSSYLFPKTRLTRCCRRSSLTIEKSSRLQVLWCWTSSEVWDGKLDLSSLVSFADQVNGPLQLHSLISNFSSTLIHLSINTWNDGTSQPLTCPSLRILEGQFHSVFPSWIDAPNLRIVIAADFTETDLKNLQVSIEELWLLRYDRSPAPDGIFDNLLQICPNLKTLKIGQDPMVREQSRVNILSILTAREEKVQHGGEIEGIKMKSLQKLVICTDLFKPAQLHELRKTVGAVIDINDYPDFIELEY